MLEKQRDEAIGTSKMMSEKLEKMKISSYKDDLRGMPIQKLKTLQVRKFIFIIL